ncbi:hypothetical protein JCM6882_007048 [Rhodosporidiobolus microsporus]
MSGSTLPPEALAALRQLEIEMLHTQCATLVVVSIILGIFLTQVAAYWRSFPRDRLGFKLLVGTLTALELGYFAVLVYNVVTAVDNALEQKIYTPQAVALQAVSLEQNWLLAGIIWCSEGYFCFVTFNVAKSWWIRGVVIALGSLEFATFLALSIGYSVKTDFSAYKQYVLLALGIWCLFAVAAFTSVVLAYHLVVKREIRPTDDVLTKFAKVAIGTSGLLAVTQLFGAVGACLHDSPIGAKMAIFISSFYAVSASVCVLWNLNHRAALRRGSGASTGAALTTGGGHSKMRSSSGWRTSTAAPARITVTMEETMEEDYGDMELDPRERWKRKEEGRQEEV